MSFINFEGTNFTLITDENENPWMIAKELCDYLEIKSVHQALRNLPADEKQKVVIEAFKSKGRGGDNGNPYGNILSKKAGKHSQMRLVGRFPNTNTVV